MSIFAHLLQQARPPASIKFVYSTKVESGAIDGARILFLPRLIALANEAGNCHVQLDLRITGSSADELSKAKGLPSRTEAGRITRADLVDALGDVKHRAGTVCYVCGPPAMTDETVAFLNVQEGMDSARVLCEKWW